jgi:5S rRNA maturation endonuclease (ribonuclease M5)
MKAETLDVFKNFEKAHGEDQAKKIITYFENADTIAIEKEIATKTNNLATKEDVANAKADMIKWMFIFWIGQIAATFGFIILYLKK